MFNWLKKLFGSDIPDTPVIAQEPKEEAPKAAVGKVTKVEGNIPAKPKAKKTKAKSVDLNAMTKKDLLALAKEKGVKANASLSKDELIKRLG